jgi:hypothetical protein
MAVQRRGRRCSVAAAAAATGEHDCAQEFCYGSHNSLLNAIVKVTAFLGAARYRRPTKRRGIAVVVLLF